MIRKALIIYCNNTSSGRLNGPIQDNLKLRSHLMSSLGGDWVESEILSLPNPDKQKVSQGIAWLDNADYSFTVFSGHGFIATNENYQQYVELLDGDIPISKLIPANPRRQTLLIDACRGYITGVIERKSLSAHNQSFGLGGVVHSTRQIFENAVLMAEEGLSILYATDENQSAADTNNGGAYIYSLLETCKRWNNANGNGQIFTIRDAHNYVVDHIRDFIPYTIQRPVMNQEKRNRYFPLAVKH